MDGPVRQNPKDERSRHRSRGLVWIVFPLILFFFMRIHGGVGASIATRQIEEPDKNRNRAISSIHAVLDSQNMKLTDAAVWNLARIIQAECENYALDAALVLAIIKVESEFDHRAVSHRGARGLMQIQPTTAAAVVKELEVPGENIAVTLHDPIANVRIGTAYLSRLKELFRDLELALIAYNWGPTWLRQRLAAKLALPIAYPKKIYVAQRTLEKTWNLYQASLFEHGFGQSESS